MKIQVLYNYGSIRLGQRRIEPGIYDIDDPALLSQGQYLVANGHAVIIEGEGAASDKAAEPPEIEAVELPPHPGVELEVDENAPTVTVTAEQQENAAPEEGDDTLILPPEPRRPSAHKPSKR